MKPKDIKRKLREKDCPMAVLARAIDRSPATVQQVIERKGKSQFVAEKVAKVLELPITEVFPDIPEYNPSFDPEASKKAHIEFWRTQLAS